MFSFSVFLPDISLTVLLWNILLFKFLFLSFYLIYVLNSLIYDKFEFIDSTIEIYYFLLNSDLLRMSANSSLKLLLLSFSLSSFTSNKFESSFDNSFLDKKFSKWHKSTYFIGFIFLFRKSLMFLKLYKSH